MLPSASNSSPFTDARFVWHMKDPGPLTIFGDARMGAPLEGKHYDESLARGGDGYAAELCGGYLETRVERDAAVAVDGTEMSLCIRFRAASQAWDSVLFASRRPFHPFLSHRRAEGDGAFLEFAWKTEPVPEVNAFCMRSGAREPIKESARNGELRVGVPAEWIGPEGWHDVIVRLSGPNLELFVDGVLVDEEWVYGAFAGFSSPFVIGGAGRCGDTFTGLIDHVAVWNRALSGNEIAVLSGGRSAVERRKLELLGTPRSSPQYWRPLGHNTFAGDCMLLYDGSRLHLFYLFDRRQHESKWRLGAHQYGHLSTSDLTHWDHHPYAIPITEQWECAIGTGEILFHDGRYYAFYTDCGARCEFPDKPHTGSGVFVAQSEDGIYFRKDLRPIARGGDCTVFRDEENACFQLLVKDRSAEGDPMIRRHVSQDLESWRPVEAPFIDAYGNCPHVFSWHGWFYLSMGHRIWVSPSANGPWKEHDPVMLDTTSYMKTAPFDGDRRIAAGWIGDGGWGGDLILRELTQREDGGLEIRFVPELMPEPGAPVDLRAHLPGGAAVDPFSSFSVGGNREGGAVTFKDVPADMRMHLWVVPQSGTGRFGLVWRAAGTVQRQMSLCFEPDTHVVTFRELGAGTEVCKIESIGGLESRFSVDIVVKTGIIDVCVDDRRTMAARLGKFDCCDLVFYAEPGKGGVRYDEVTVTRIA